MQVALKPDPDIGGGQEFVTEALIPVSQGPVASTDGDSGTATNCEPNLPW
jgi:hypothetical protein